MIDACRRKLVPCPLRFGRVGGARRGGAANCVAGREPIPLLSRSDRHGGASRHVAEPVRDRPPPPRSIGRTGAQRTPPRWMELRLVREDLLGLDTQPLCLPRAVRLPQSQEPYSFGPA